MIMIISIIMCLVSCDHTDIMVTNEMMSAEGIVQLSKIEVYPQYLDEYMGFAVKV